MKANRMTTRGSFVLILAAAEFLQAQVAHPRIWLDAPTMTRLTALKKANDPTWRALKEHADVLLKYTVIPYDPHACASNQICYSWQGSGWGDALETLSLAYKMTGDTAYSDQVIRVLNAMVPAGAAPMAIDAGYPSRMHVVGLALAYDWVYDRLDDSLKHALGGLLDAYWVQLRTNGYQWGPNASSCSNYYGGHVLGFGLAALAMEGDSTNAQAIGADVLKSVRESLIPAYTSRCFAGGYPVEGYNYGPPNLIRNLEYFWAMTTAGKAHLLTKPDGSAIDYIQFARNAARSAIFNLRPDHWSTTDEGDFAGDFSRVMQPAFPYALSGLLGDHVEGQWMRYFYSNMAQKPGGTPSYLMPSTVEAFLFQRSDLPASDYRTGLPPAYFSAGDQHTVVRSSWADDAVHTTFDGGTMIWADHQSNAAGHISIQRGPDYLLVNSGQWKGSEGFGGRPEVMDGSGWRMNSLFYEDGGTAAGGSCIDPARDSRYRGCHGFWPALNSVVHLETANYVFSKADLRSAYFNNHDQTTIRSYFRTFANLGGDATFVFDRVTFAKPSATRKLLWHFNARAVNAVNGNVVTSVLGGSALKVAVLLPENANVALVDETESWEGGKKILARAEVADTAASTESVFLTVLATSAANLAPPTISLIKSANYRGASYDDGVHPRIALFSADGRSQSHVEYHIDTKAGLTTRHVVFDLAPGVYSSSQAGTTVASGLRAGADGSLTFEATGGGEFVVRREGP
jgi:hypothetical protein